MNLKELEQKRALKLTEATAALRSDKASDVRFAAYDAAVAEIQALDGEIARHRQAAEFETEERKRAEAVEAALRAGRPALPQPGNVEPADRESTKEETEKRNREHRSAFTHYIRTKDDSQLRAMGSTVGSQGGYAIPVLTQPALEQALLAFGGVIPYLDGMPTETGVQIDWPLNNDTANSGREIGENVDSTETGLVLGIKAMTVGLFSTDVVLIPRTLLRDSAFDLAGKVTDILAIRRARKLAVSAILGTQTNASFDSLVNGAALGATSAAPGTIALADVGNVFGAVDPGYAFNGSFVSNRGTQIYLSNQRNGLGAPIFPLDKDGLVTTLYGRPLVIDQNMPNLGAGTRPLIFGDLKKYIFRSVGTMEVMRLEERYATANQIAFLGFYSAGGSLIDAGTHPIQALQEHA